MSGYTELSYCTTLHDGRDVEVFFEYLPGDAGCFSGPPDRWEPPCPSEITIQRVVLLGGSRRRRPLTLSVEQENDLYNEITSVADELYSDMCFDAAIDRMERERDYE